MDVDWNGAPAVLKDTRRLSGRPGFVQLTNREAEVYTHVLQPEGVWAPKLLARADGSIVLERLDALPLWQMETHEIAARVGEVLRAIHDALHAAAEASPFLLRYDERFYDRWFRRASILTPSVRLLQRAHDEATRTLLEQRMTVIHGELYPANVLVRGDDVRLIDWESAGVAPAVVDLAAVTTGWDNGAVDVLLDAYGEVDRIALECARFHLALRWLGWSAAWRPPLEHRRDWLAEAHAAADLFGRRAAA